MWRRSSRRSEEGPTLEYRRLPKGTEEISAIGFGGSGLHQAGEKAGAETVLAAIEHGVNYFDMAVSEAAAFKSYRAAFAGYREQLYLQMYFAADYSSGQRKLAEHGIRCDGHSSLHRPNRDCERLCGGDYADRNTF